MVKEKSLRLSFTASPLPPVQQAQKRKWVQWEFIVALVIAIPIILFPAAFIWYLNIGGIYALIKESWEKRVAR